MLESIGRQLKNIARFGPVYECHNLRGKLTGGLFFTKRDYVKEENYFLRHPELYRPETESLYKRTMKRPLNLENPVLFTEKIQRIKLFDSTPLKTRLADKYAVREWVSSKLGDEVLIPLYGCYERFEDIDFSSLPSSFALKCNHGSGMNLIVKDKREFDKAAAKKLTDLWMSRNFAFFAFELHYSAIPRRILAEKYMEEIGWGGGTELYDYKIHCFHGNPQFIQLIGNRDLIRHTGCQTFYDTDWNKLDWTFEDYPPFPYPIPKPENLDELLHYAATLSADFPYVRVDFYDIGKRILFGEMTFTPASGIYPYRGTWTQERDRELGDLVQLKSD